MLLRQERSWEADSWAVLIWPHLLILSNPAIMHEGHPKAALGSDPSSASWWWSMGEIFRSHRFRVIDQASGLLLSTDREPESIQDVVAASKGVSPESRDDIILRIFCFYGRSSPLSVYIVEKFYMLLYSFIWMLNSLFMIAIIANQQSSNRRQDLTFFFHDDYHLVSSLELLSPLCRLPFVWLYSGRMWESDRGKMTWRMRRWLVLKMKNDAGRRRQTIYPNDFSSLSPRDPGVRVGKMTFGGKMWLVFERTIRI